MTLSVEELEEAHDFAAQLAVRAGQMLRQNAWDRIRHAWGPRSGAGSKGNDTAAAAPLNEQLKNGSSTDIVTDVDLSVERFVVSELKKRYSQGSPCGSGAAPAWEVLAEEEYAASGETRYISREVSSSEALRAMSA